MQATLVVLCVLTAAPDQLGEATRALDDLKYEAALEGLPPQSALEAWRREDVLSWFSTRALALLGLKREAEARDGFLRLFSLAPEWVLPDHYGPRVRTVVAAARAEATSRGALSLRFEGGLLRATKDPWGYGGELEVSWREPQGPVQTLQLPLVDRQPAPWPNGKRLEVWGRVLGLGGSTLLEWGTENAAIRLEPLEVVQVGSGSGTAPVRGFGPLGAVGLGAGAAAVLSFGLGVGFAVSSQDAERALAGVARDGEGRITSLTQRAAFALDVRAADQAGVATGCFVAAAVLVTAGAGLVLFDRLRVLPTAGGAMVVIPLDASFAFAGLR